MNVKNPAEAQIVHREPKILYYDIETTELKADWGEMLMVGWKWGGEDDVNIKTICDFKGWRKKHPSDRDAPIVDTIREQMLQADVIVGHYSTKFDYRFINTRAIINGQHVLPRVPHVDTWRASKFNLSLRNNTMRNIAEALGAGEQKSHVDKRIWRAARAHDPAAIKIIAEYCKQDVRTQEAITIKLLPFLKEMPNMQILFGVEERVCPRCGSQHLVENGVRAAASRVYQRYICRACGTSSRASVGDKNIKSDVIAL